MTGRLVTWDRQRLDPLIHHGGWSRFRLPHLTLPGIFKLLMPLLKKGTVTSLAGIKKFTGTRSH